MSTSPSQHAALEQAAREWLISQNRYWTDVAGVKRVNESEIPALVTLLAAQRAAVLEEVEKEVKGRRCELGLKLTSSRPLFSGLREKYEGQDEALRLLEGWISKRAQEPRP